MLSGDDDALDLKYLTSYKNATFANGSFNPETRTAYVDEVEVAFAKGNTHTTMGAKKAVIKKKSKPVPSKTLSSLPGHSSSTGAGKKIRKKTRGKKKREQMSAREEFMADISNGAEVTGRRVWTEDNDTETNGNKYAVPTELGEHLN